MNSVIRKTHWKIGKDKKRNPGIREEEKVESKEGTLLFHPTHGPFIVKGILKKPELGGDGLSYWLEPDRRQRLGTRFFIAVSRIQEAGFHPPISREEAQAILEYLKNGEEPKVRNQKERVREIYALVQENTPWALAKILLIVTRANPDEHSREAREAFQLAVRGLGQELAFVLKIPVGRALSEIRKSFAYSLRSSPWFQGVFQSVS